MLAQNFKTAEDLCITDPQRNALMKVLVLLETGKMEHVPRPSHNLLYEKPASFEGKFNMAQWGAVPSDCGTVACIGGTAEIVGDVKFGGCHREELPWNLYDLFYPFDNDLSLMLKITPAQAAIALRSYLTTGDARWDLAVK